MDLLELFSINESNLPEVRASNGDFGQTGKEASAVKEFPLEELQDQQSSLFGHAAFSRGTLRIHMERALSCL